MLVEIGAQKIITEYTQEQKNTIMDELSISNPKYESAIRFSSYTRTSIPMYLTYYYRMKDVLVVPRGYDIPYPHKIVADERFKCDPIEYPPFLLTLRSAQQEAVDAYLRNREKGNGTIVLPTGKGKSIIGIYLAKHLQQKCLVIVHKDDLVDGWKKDIKLTLGLRPKQVGIIKGKEFRIGRFITLATIQTLSKLPADKLKLLRETFPMLIADECHHTPASTFELISYFPGVDRIGLTATDMRNDGLRGVIEFYFGKVCYRFKEIDNDEDIISAKDVIVKIKDSGIYYEPPQEYVSPNRRKPIKHFYYDKERIVIDDLSQKEIEFFIHEKQLKRKPLLYSETVKTIQEDAMFMRMITTDIKFEFKNKKSCLILCTEKDHCRAIKESLLENGIPEKYIQLYFGDSTESKSSMKLKAEKRECLITIATYAIAKEGTNVKAWERIFLAMTINNELDTTQAIGRGRRTNEGKTNLVVYDYSHYNVKGAKRHIETRTKVYKKLGFKIESTSNKIVNFFHKGFRRAK